MGVGHVMFTRSLLLAALAHRHCLFVLGVALALAIGWSGAASAKGKGHHHPKPPHAHPKPPPQQAKPQSAPQPSAHPHKHAHPQPGHEKQHSYPHKHANPQQAGHEKQHEHSPATGHKHEKGHSHPHGKQHAHGPQHSSAHPHAHAKHRPHGHRHGHHKHAEDKHAKSSPLGIWKAHHARRAHATRERLRHGTRHRRERDQPKPVSQAAAAPSKPAPAAKPTTTKPTYTAALPALPSALSPSTQPSEKSLAQAKGPETTAQTTAQEPSSLGEGQPMRLGAPREPDEEDTRSLVKSAADKARAARPDEQGRRPVISLGTGAPPLVGTYRKDEIITGQLPPAVSKYLAKYEFEIKQASVPGLTRVQLPPRHDAWEIVRSLEREFPKQGWALNYIYRPYRPEVEDTPTIAPIPPNPSKGCDTERCYARKGWDTALAACAAGVRVGVIDTGYDRHHPALERANITLVMGSNDDKAKNWHGTAVLALLAGVADASTPGFIPGAEFLLANAFYEVAGETQTDTLRLVEALDKLQDAQIINMSLVGPRDDLLRDRISDLSRHRGVIFIAAAGNGGETAPPAYPAAYPEVIAVSAVDSKGQSYRHGTQGDYINVAAPGVGIWTAWPGRKEARVTGTSFAAPYVTALAAITYHGNPLKAAIEAGRKSFDPKKATLAGFEIRKVQTAEERRIVGEGLIKAPGSCTPRHAPSWVARVNPRMRVPGAWAADVNPVAYQRATH